MATELKWNEIDPATLSPSTQDAYADYKRAYQTMKEVRGIFEAALNAEAKNAGVVDMVTTELKVGYKFGKLSVAIGSCDKPKAKPATGGLAGLRR